VLNFIPQREVRPNCRGMKSMNSKSTDPLTQDEDIKFLAENTDLSPLQAKDLIEKHGRDRKVLLEEAKKFKAES